MGILLIVSAVPGAPSHGGQDTGLLGLIPPIVQNLLHIPAYALLTFLWLRALEGHGLAFRRCLAVAVLIAAGYGGALEALQAWVPGRSAAAGDLLLNLAGVLLLAALASRIPRFRSW